MTLRRTYAGGAVPTTLATGISNVDTTATLVSLTGYPTGSSKWYAVIDRGEATEEKVLVTQVSAFVVTISRGQDGTVAQSHSAGAGFEHCITATDADEANEHVTSTGSAHGLPVGASFVGTIGAQTIEDKTLDFSPIGGNNVATNIPTSASPAIMAAIAAVDADLAAETATRAAETADRYTKAQSDSRYIEAAGDTMTGALVLATSSPSAALHAASKGYVDKASPIGEITMYGGSAAPSGWLLCDGSAVSRATYADLFAAIGVNYGAGNGSTTFNLPNLVGRFPVGLNASDSDFNALSDTGGSKNHSHTTASHTHTTPAHSHPLSDNGAAKIVLDDSNNWVKGDVTGGFSSWTADARTDTNANVQVIASSVSSTQGAGLTGDTDNSAAGVTGGSGALATDSVSGLPPFAVVNFIIRAS
ncbi:MAG: phage tail protein [Dehalococcoidia bacterium]